MNTEENTIEYSRELGSRIMVIGDAWAKSMLASSSRPSALQNVLEEKFDNLFKIIGDASETRTLDSWISSSSLEVITRELVRNQSVDIIHLSLGINEFLVSAIGDKPIPYLKIKQSLEILITHILSLRAKLKVLLVGYPQISLATAWGPADSVAKLQSILE